MNSIIKIVHLYGSSIPDYVIERYKSGTESNTITSGKQHYNINKNQGNA